MLGQLEKSRPRFNPAKIRQASRGRRVKESGERERAGDLHSSRERPDRKRLGRSARDQHFKVLDPSWGPRRSLVDPVSQQDPRREKFKKVCGKKNKTEAKGKERKNEKKKKKYFGSGTETRARRCGTAHTPRDDANESDCFFISSLVLVSLLFLVPRVSFFFFFFFFRFRRKKNV